MRFFSKFLCASYPPETALESFVPRGEIIGDIPEEWERFEFKLASTFFGETVGPIKFVPLSSLRITDTADATSRRELYKALLGPHPYFTAIVICSDNSIDNGNHRVRWARRHGFKTIPAQLLLSRG